MYKKCILSSENQKIDQGGEPKIKTEIHNTAGIRYHEVPIYRLLHKWFQANSTKKGFGSIGLKEEKGPFKKIENNLKHA